MTADGPLEREIRLSTTGSEPIGGDIWRAGLAVALAFYLDSATLVSVAVGLPVWRSAFGLTPWHVGLLGGGLALALAVGSLVGGHLADRFGRLRVFTVDLVVYAAGASVLLVASGPCSLVVGAVLVGLAAGADVPTGLAVLADAGPQQERGRLTGTTQVAWISAILITYSLAVVVADLGLLGVRLLVVHLLLLSLLTLVVRLRQLPLVPTPPGSQGPAVVPRGEFLPGRADLWPLVLVGSFYLAWSLAASTLGSFGAYFMVTVSGLQQREATLLALLGFLPAAGMALLFVRLADTAWRERLFPVAAVLQVVAFGVAAATGGTVVAGMVAAIVLYSLSNVFGGEAAYKVWGQLLFPDHRRATALGATYAAARLASAAFLLLVPVMIATRPAVLLWLLTGFVAVSGLMGLQVIRHQRGLSGGQPD